MAEDYTAARVTCMGRRFEDGKLCVLFSPDGGDIGLFPLNSTTRRYQIGGIYTIRMDADRRTALFSKTPFEDLVGRLPTDETAALRIASEAAEAQYRAFKGHKKIGTIQEAVDVLGPVRDIYRSSDRTTRRLIELTVLDYLRR